MLQLDCVHSKKTNDDAFSFFDDVLLATYFSCKKCIYVGLLCSKKMDKMTCSMIWVVKQRVLILLLTHFDTKYKNTLYCYTSVLLPKNFAKEVGW